MKEKCLAAAFVCPLAAKLAVSNQKAVLDRDGLKGALFAFFKRVYFLLPGFFGTVEVIPNCKDQKQAKQYQYQSGYFNQLFDNSQTYCLFIRSEGLHSGNISPVKPSSVNAVAYKEPH